MSTPYYIRENFPKRVYLLAFERQNRGEFLPFAIWWHLDGGAFALAQDENTVVLAGQGGFEIFAAIVIDHLECGLLAFHFGTDDGPAETVVVFAKIAGQLA